MPERTVVSGVQSRGLRHVGPTLVGVVCLLLAASVIFAVLDRLSAADTKSSLVRGPPSGSVPLASSTGTDASSSAPPSSEATQPTTGSSDVPPPTDSAAKSRLLALLHEVTVVPSRPNVPGYERDCGPGEGCVFGTAWNDDTSAPLGHNGCDTRNDVLRRDLTDIEVDADTNGCVVRSGTLLDPYTGRAIDFVRGYYTSTDVQIDHLIPLAAAWDLGAWEWSPERRAAFANDVEHELLAVDGPSNLSKVDSTPASWLPPNKAFRCEYGTLYLEASIFWDLPITAADADVLLHVARKCR